MRYILFLLMALNFGFARAQSEEDENKIKPTTKAEYDFVTVGYQIQLNTGLPMRDGYTLKEYESCEFEHTTVKVKALFRKEEEAPCAIMLIYNERFQKPRYFCVPTKDADSEIWELYFASLELQHLNNNSWLQYMTYCTGSQIMEIHHKSYDKN